MLLVSQTVLCQLGLCNFLYPQCVIFNIGRCFALRAGQPECRFDLVSNSHNFLIKNLIQELFREKTKYIFYLYFIKQCTLLVRKKIDSYKIQQMGRYALLYAPKILPLN
jgi:hypothetical protein